jgi:lysophospholipase L1-like esterase
MATLLTACQTPSSPSGPTASPTPTSAPSPTSVHPVSGLVFYDENANGVRDDGERVLLPRVGVTIGSRTAHSDGEGRFTIPDAPAGTRAATVEASTLPAFFQMGRGTSVAVPPANGFMLAVPVALPIRGNHPNVYMAFGDSITQGDGSRGRRGYRDDLARQLRGYWGAAEVMNEGESATRSSDGAARLGASLAAVRPAYALILYGSNDWNSFVCRHVAECFTLPSLRAMIREARAAGSVPVVGTLLPVNPASRDPLAAARNAWVIETNSLLRPLVRQEGAVLADVHTAFMDEAGSNLPALFTDHVHPNDRGYGVIADEFFRAITRPVGAGAAAGSDDFKRE